MQPAHGNNIRDHILEETLFVLLSVLEIIFPDTSNAGPDITFGLYFSPYRKLDMRNHLVIIIEASWYRKTKEEL